MKVFCVSYAGSSAAFFNRWNTYSKKTDEVSFIPLEYSGHGLFVNKELIGTFEDSLLFLYNQLKDFDVEEFCLFGHSLGAYFVFEITKKLLTEDRKLPKYLYLSAAKPPQLKEKYKLENDTDLKKLLVKYGAIPPEVLNDPDIFRYFKPIIENDFLVYNDYCLSDNICLPVETRIFYGTDDSIDFQTIRGWELHFQSSVSYSLVQGDHFFINSNLQTIINIINKDRNDFNG